MSLNCICVCVWKRSYLCTRCRRVFRDRYFFDDARENIAKRAGKRGELLVGRTENFFLYEQTRWVEMGSWRWGCHWWGHWSNGGYSWVCQVGEWRRGERGESKRTWSFWTIPWWWRQLTASRTERMTVMASCSVDFPFARMRSKGSPPLVNSKER